MTNNADNAFEVGGVAAIINSRLAADARLNRAIGLAWLCGGFGIALCLIATGAAIGFLGYSCLISVRPAATEVARAFAHALENAELRTTVSGTMALSPNSEVKLAPGQIVRLDDRTTIKLDPNSSVRIIGDVRVPQPSSHQLQQDTVSKSRELPFTNYVIFRSVPLGRGVVETGWMYDLSDPLRPQLQHCYYRQSLVEGLAGKITLAINGTPEELSQTNLPFKPEEALANCV
jgi:hypothetical protein